MRLQLCPSALDADFEPGGAGQMLSIPFSFASPSWAAIESICSACFGKTLNAFGNGLYGRLFTIAGCFLRSCANAWSFETNWIVFTCGIDASAARVRSI